MKHINYLMFLFILIAPFSAQATSYSKNYTRAEVDSLLREQQIEYNQLIQKRTEEILRTYITQQNNYLTEHDTHIETFIAIACAILALISALVGVVFPLVYNNQQQNRMEDRINKSIGEMNKTIAKSLSDSKKKIDNHLKKRLEKASEQIETKIADELTDINKEIKRHQDFIDSIKDIMKKQNVITINSENPKHSTKETDKEASISEIIANAKNEADQETRIKILSEASKSNPQSIDILMALGWEFMNAEQNDQAISTFNKVLDIDHHYPYAYLNRGYVFLKKYQYNKAIRDLKSVINEKPDILEAYEIIGRVFENKFMLEEAQKYYNKGMVKAKELGDEKNVTLFFNHVNRIKGK